MKAIAAIAIAVLAATASVEAAPSKKAHAVKAKQHSSSDSLDVSEGWWDDLWGNSNSNNNGNSASDSQPKKQSHWWDGIFGGSNDTPDPPPRQPRVVVRPPKKTVSQGGSGQCGSKATQASEALCTVCYLDSKGIPSIGVGLNLEVPGNRRMLEQHGVVLDDIQTQRRVCLHGANHCTTRSCRPGEKNCMSAKLAQDIFDTKTWPTMLANADRFVPNLPPNVRGAVADMSMMGFAALSKFKKMKAALVRGDYSDAANEARNSKWCRDVGIRCKATTKCMASGR
ncbi:hypothetical protein HDU97_009527 [Phlyctochytrium planicorne]|nr:hypothetical protein HDU97_009527 [Phlyctochytrium planicorne]